MRHADRSEAFNSPSPVFSPFNLIQIKRLAVHGVYTAIFLLLWTGTGVADTEKKGPTLVRAVMCETIENYLPIYPAVVFSIARDTIICFTSFDPVPETTDIFHKWYRQDRLVSLTKLTLKPPKWASFSSMQLRAVDKGPWRVDIVNKDDTVIKTLRFSISD
ncbi:MAG: DUF2914 domain-containing protein [Desulfobacterium sp.]|jgi:hypothetical protein|nr:DUF2914 domain-containing protein [Desulfobacterium sp.]